MKVVSLILRISLTFVASLLLIVSPVNAQTLTQVNPASPIELVANQSDIMVMLPQVSHRSVADAEQHWGCNCTSCTQAQLLLLGQLPLTSLI